MNMLSIDVGAPPPPDEETRAFIQRYAEDSQKRLDVLSTRNGDWWQQKVLFFGAPRVRAWVTTRRIAHTAHHRGQQTTLLRILGRDLYSTYGPSADTGGLMQQNAPVIYPYADAGSWDDL